jgi:Lysylphosphatidylglycerol synthase TM region
MKLRSRLLALISAISGLALLIIVIKRTGLGEILARLQSLGPGFLLILAISSIRYLSRSFAWLRCMAPDERQVGFWPLWQARLAGEAIGDLTFGPVVAEPLRLVALGNRVPLSSGISSLAVENISYTVSSCLMVICGTLALLASIGLHESLRAAVMIALSVVAVLTLSAVIIVSRSWRVASGIAAATISLILRQKDRMARMKAQIDHLRNLEDYVFDFYAKRPRDFFLLVLSHAVFHFAGVIEIYTTMRLIGVDLTLVTAFMLEALNRALNIAFIFVPALVGVDEAGTGLVTSALGFGAATGVALAIIRKIRMFFWIGVGLVFLFGSKTTKKLKVEDEAPNRQR